MEKKTKKKVSEQILLARKRAGITQQELADKAGVSRRVIGGIERGDYNVSLETAAAVFRALDLTEIKI